MKSAKELLQTMLSKIGGGFSSASVEVLTELVTIQLDEAGTLSKRIGDDKRLAISRMKVIGALDSSDVKCLRNMPQLEELDLLDARIVTGGCYYIEAWYCQNEQDVMGLYMFHRNAKLKSIIFPKGVLAIRPMAFRRCSALSEVVFSPVLERIDDRAFSYCDSLEQLSFPPALQTIGPRGQHRGICFQRLPIAIIGEFGLSPSEHRRYGFCRCSIGFHQPPCFSQEDG